MMLHIYLINLVAIIPRVNSISNKCKFDVLRIDSKDILCQDYGYNKVYCNSKYIPDEFIIYNENSIQGKKATGERYLPRKAREALTKKEYKRTTAAKRKGIRQGKQLVRQPKKIAKKTAKYRKIKK